MHTVVPRRIDKNHITTSGKSQEEAVVLFYLLYIWFALEMPLFLILHEYFGNIVIDWCPVVANNQLIKLVTALRR